MHHYNGYHQGFHHTPMQQPPYNPGLLGVLGGVINLTTTVLYGGARIVRTVVEGSVWYGEYPPHHHAGCGCHHHHQCHVQCCPETHDCCGCC